MKCAVISSHKIRMVLKLGGLKDGFHCTRKWRGAIQAEELQGICIICSNFIWSITNYFTRNAQKRLFTQSEQIQYQWRSWYSIISRAMCEPKQTIFHSFIPSFQLLSMLVNTGQKQRWHTYIHVAFYDLNKILLRSCCS